MALAQTVTNVL